MKYREILWLLACISIVQGACEATRKRSEIRELSETERNSFIDSVLELKRQGKYDDFVLQHMVGFPFAHNSPLFFPWHRQYLLNFENTLRKINPNVTVPYWDWTLDSQAPEASPIFKWFGGNGKGEDHCVDDGPFANWETSVPKKKCLQRQFDLQSGLISPLQSPELLNEDIDTSKNYSTLQMNIEMGTHSLVHVGIGGNEGDMSFEFSSNDPIFWLLHSFVDKIWTIWQTRDPQNLLSYDGINPITNKAVALSDHLDLFDAKVGDVMDIKSLCYQYSKIPKIHMPSGQISHTTAPTTTPSHTSIIRPTQSPKPNVLGIIKRFNRNTSTLMNLNKRTVLYGNIPAYFDIYGGPAPDDREEEFQLRIPMGLPQQFIDRMGYSTNLVRAIEIRHADLTQRINQLKDYISPVSLARKIETERVFFN